MTSLYEVAAAAVIETQETSSISQFEEDRKEVKDIIKQ